MDRISLEQFRDLKLSKDELYSLAKQHEAFKLEKPVEVCAIHIIKLLTNYQNQLISEKDILDWVNTIWFSDWFEYCDEQGDCIASVMNELEETDEKDNGITQEKIEVYIAALRNNIEV